MLYTECPSIQAYIFNTLKAFTENHDIFNALVMKPKLYNYARLYGRHLNCPHRRRRRHSRAPVINDYVNFFFLPLSLHLSAFVAVPILSQTVCSLWLTLRSRRNTTNKYL